jgi:acylphosphatase
MGEHDETVSGSVAGSDVRFHVIVSGRVQGVFFRDACRQTARDLGVRGWVRNRSDGAVELVAEGARPAVDRLVSWCCQGPPQARVTDMEIIAETPAGEDDFEVVG